MERPLELLRLTSLMEFKDKESWQAVTNGVLQYHKAEEVDPVHPSYVEPRYYFRVIRVNSLICLAQRTLGIVGGKYADTLPSHLDTLRNRSQ